MNRHLSSEHVTNWIIGERSPETEEHVQHCELCRSEIKAFESALDDFRVSVHREADARYHPRALRLQEGRIRAIVHAWPQSGVAALAIILICFFISRYKTQVAAPAALQIVRSQSLSDAALWAEIDEQTSRTASSAMDPLLQKSGRAGSGGGQDFQH